MHCTEKELSPIPRMVKSCAAKKQQSFLRRVLSLQAKVIASRRIASRWLRRVRRKRGLIQKTFLFK